MGSSGKEMDESAKLLGDRMVRDAEEIAAKVLDEARKAIEALVAERINEAKEKAYQDTKDIIDSAKAEAERLRMIAQDKVEKEAKIIALSEKEKLINRTRDLVKTKMEAFIHTREYPSYLERLISDGIKALNDGEVLLLLNKRDAGLKINLRKIAEKITSEVGKPTAIKLLSERIPNIGGAIIKSADGRIVVDNTIEGVITRESGRLRLMIAHELFGS